MFFGSERLKVFSRALQTFFMGDVYLHIELLGLRSWTKMNPLKFKVCVIETLPNAEFNVELKNGHRLLGRISEEMKHKLVTILPGDVVTIVLSPEDLNLGRIIYRASS